MEDRQREVVHFVPVWVLAASISRGGWEAMLGQNGRAAAPSEGRAPPAQPSWHKANSSSRLAEREGRVDRGAEEGLGLAQAGSYCRGLARAGAPMCAAARVGGSVGSTVQR